MRTVFSFVLLLLMAPRFDGQRTVEPDSEQSRILSLENAWNQAVQQKDATALKILLGPELVYVDYDGKLMDKTEYLASVQAQSSLHPGRIMNESMKVYVFDAVAVVNGVYREDGAKNGKPYVLRERFTDTWIRRSGSWMCVASQSTLTTQ
jgi:ketosteroid isomerase-like protein